MASVGEPINRPRHTEQRDRSQTVLAAPRDTKGAAPYRGPFVGRRGVGNSLPCTQPTEQTQSWELRRLSIVFVIIQPPGAKGRCAEIPVSRDRPSESVPAITLLEAPRRHRLWYRRAPVVLNTPGVQSLTSFQ